MTVYAYLRVSTDKQDENNQKEGVDYKAEKLGLQIDEYIAEHVSGATDPERRKLGELISRVKAGDIIIISEISRLGRKLFMLFGILESLCRRGIQVYSVKEDWKLDDTLQSKMLAFCFGMSAEIERSMISARTKEALQRKKKEGVHLGRKVGYCPGKFYKAERYSKEIRELVNQGYSLSKICRTLNLNVKTVRGFLRKHNIPLPRKYTKPKDFNFQENFHKSRKV